MTDNLSDRRLVHFCRVQQVDGGVPCRVQRCVWKAGAVEDEVPVLVVYTWVNRRAIEGRAASSSFRIRTPQKTVRVGFLRGDLHAALDDRAQRFH